MCATSVIQRCILEVGGLVLNLGSVVLGLRPGPLKSEEGYLSEREGIPTFVLPVSACGGDTLRACLDFPTVTGWNCEEISSLALCCFDQDISLQQK